MFFDCSKFKGLKIADGVALRSFELKECDGQDETYANARAKAKGSDTYTELLRYSIAKVNGEPVTQPYEAFDKWNARARAFVISAWRSLNSADDDEIKDFLALASEKDSAP